MNPVKTADLRAKERQELEAILREHQTQLGRLTFDRERKTLQKSSDIRKVKREIARIHTILHEHTR